MKDRAYEIVRNRNYNGDQRALSSVVYKVFDKKTGSWLSVNEQPAEELHKPVIRKFKRKKVCRRFKDNTWASELKWDHCLLRMKILNIYYVSLTFSLNIHGLNL